MADKKSKAKKIYGRNETAINNIIRGMRRLGIAPKGLLADGVAGSRFDHGVVKAVKGEKTRAFLHLVMYEACQVDPDVQSVSVQTWSPQADEVLDRLKHNAANEAANRTAGT